MPLVLPAFRRTSDHRLATTPSSRRSRRRPSRLTMVWRPSPSRLLSVVPLFLLKPSCIVVVEFICASLLCGWVGRRRVLMTVDGMGGVRAWYSHRWTMGARAVCTCRWGWTRECCTCLLVGGPTLQDGLCGVPPNVCGAFPNWRVGLVWTDRTAAVYVMRRCWVTRSHRAEKHVRRKLVYSRRVMKQQNRNTETEQNTKGNDSG